MARCRGHKICIDMGYFYTGRTCLFNIDTFEAIYFESKENIWDIFWLLTKKTKKMD